MILIETSTLGSEGKRIVWEVIFPHVPGSYRRVIRNHSTMRFVSAMVLLHVTQ